MDHDLLLPTIIFDPPASSPDRHRRRRHRHRRVPPFLFRGDWVTGSDSDYSPDTDSCSSCSSSDDGGGFAIYPHHHHRRGRHRHRHIHLPAGLGITSNALVRRPPAAAGAAVPRNYGYRRMHYQGGQERRGRRRTRAGGPARGGCGGGRSPRRNILVRCGRWLFGDSRRCYCGRSCAPATGCCGEERSRSRSPTRHREEEYWGPGLQNWAYGPSGNDANWRDTPWAGGSNGGPQTFNLAPGGTVEEVEEGGTLPTTAAIAAGADQTHNHYHIGANGRSRRSSQRRDVKDYMRDLGVLDLVNRERDRELDRNIMDRETAKQRDHHLLALLDRERQRDRGGKDIIELLDQELERRRKLYPRASTTSQSKKNLKTSQQSSDKEDELRAEMEALRHDFRKLMRSTTRNRGTVGTEKAKQLFLLTSDDEDGEDEDEGTIENDTASVSRKVLSDGGTGTDQVLQMPSSPPDEASNPS